jgi:hypothetical protein
VGRARLWFAVGLALALMPPVAARANEVPDRYGLGITLGHAYDPEAIDFVQLAGFALYDYDRVWSHPAPEPLRFKVEASAGVTTHPRTRAMVSANMLACYYLERLATARLKPYAEAGIGLIYTDLRVSGQGWRFNFNPQAGFGAEITAGDGPPWFVAVRLHHLSNGRLFHENRGVNSVVLQIGRFF